MYYSIEDETPLHYEYKEAVYNGKIYCWWKLKDINSNALETV